MPLLHVQVEPCVNKALQILHRVRQQLEPENSECQVDDGRVATVVWDEVEHCQETSAVVKPIFIKGMIHVYLCRF